MSDSLNANEQRLEEIVAYLDGELSPEESARVERKLASDESYRQQLQSIERAWSALDELPLAIVDDRFSRTTMEMAVNAAAAEVQEKTIALPAVQRRRRYSTLLAALTAAALGFLVFRLAWQNSDRMLLADLPVIDNVDLYSQFDEPEFLRRLRADLGDEFEQLVGESSAVPQRAERMHAVSPVDLRGDWLKKLDDEERTHLRAKFNRFRELPPQEQQRLRELHEQIVSAADAEKLQQTMLAYDEWLGGLPPARQFELRSMPLEQRVQTVNRWADEMRDDALFALSNEELRQLARKIRKPLEELMRPGRKNQANDGDNRQPGRQFAAKGPGLNQFPGALAKQFAQGVTERGEFQTVLLEALPERTREAFQSLPPREKVDRVMTWMRQAESLQGEVSQEELERFFADELDAQQRAELLALPPGDMQQALRRLYRCKTGWGFGNPGAWGMRGDRGRGEGGEGEIRHERDPRHDRNGPPRGREGGRPPGPGGPGGHRDFRPPPPREGERPPENEGPPR